MEWDNRAIICDTLGRSPDIEIGSRAGGWSLCRWRQFVGSYSLPALPDPLMSIHLSGKPQVRTWDRDDWSEKASIPGCTTIVPAGARTSWLVDGELDVVTLSISGSPASPSFPADRTGQIQFALMDPLGVALARQIVAELYAPDGDARKIYLSSLIEALKMHMINGDIPANRTAEIPVTGFSTFRLHKVVNAIHADPGADHSVGAMAGDAGISRSQFSRIFRKAFGRTPQQYVSKVRLERAATMLTQGGMSIALISEELGFASQSHFTRAFKNHYGQTPSAYRSA